MKAAVLRQVGAPLVIEQVDLASTGPEEVRIRVAASGLCHSDYHFMVGDMPHPLPVVLGHEASGEVIAVGEDVRGIVVGDRVVTCISTFCGECAQCQGGTSYRCDTPPSRPGIEGVSRLSQGGRVVHQFGQLGGFAEEMLVHAHSVSKLPEGMPLETAALLGCAVLTGVGAAINRASVGPGDTVAVVGCGGVGLNVIQGARIAGATRIVAVDLTQAKLDLARRFGATDTVLGGPDAAAEVVELTGGGVDHAFEVIGNIRAIRQAFDMTAKGGQLVLVGVPPLGSEIPLPALPLLKKEVRVTGSLMGSMPFQLGIPALARMAMAGQLEIEALVSQRIALEQVNEGYAAMAAGEVARSLICFG